MKELMMALMVWASPVVGLPVPADTPEVVFLDRCEMQEVTGRECEPGLQTYGAHQSGTVMLRDDWTPDNIRDVAILVHELVHYMQHEHGVSHTPCTAESHERPAYAAEIAFLRSSGRDPMDVIQLRPIQLAFLTTCVPPL